ncbi:MAG TPA: UDP-N-acetylglucosamine 2-epimerase (non-hydrolyzing) [Gaiellaceae bacterium]|jgi:UDP-N-acetylglucosamine 2-epimerase (non-hydrolysing)|nr:UDP-N-acetylglucosamine 2-epimerase (non-hydrolyzing) [Gaiellaceae bacterium]HWJ44765.1 UDP-N-acetylglucosamine 2-epimerase (non-hydrolyzing) [Gaiellaceae bacterium]
MVVHVVGARPNYMKVAPVYAALERRGNVEQRLVHTGQHYDTLLKDVFFAELPLPRPHVQLEARTPATAVAELEHAFGGLQPDLVVVAGDVNSTLAGAVAARRRGIRVCHIESGLRSGDWSMPEEVNRVIADHLSALLLTTLPSGERNLREEHLPQERIRRVGNTMIDTLQANLEAARALEAWRELGQSPQGYVLVTLHRPGLVDDREALGETIAALEDVAKTVPVIFPVHPRTKKNLGDVDRVVLTEPLPYRQFLSLEAAAAAVVTDSGGIQEETTVLGVPCFTLRDNTERPETLEGTNRLVRREQLRDVPRLLHEPTPGRVPELWDGHADERAAAAIEDVL